MRSRVSAPVPAKAGAASAHRVARERVVGKAREEARQGDLRFEPREAQSCAGMDAEGERDVPVGFAGQVEPVRIGKLRGIAIGRPHSERDERALWKQPAADFERLGGFPSVRFMEDVEFSKRLRRKGRVVVLPQRIFVSPRRWQKVGVARQTLRNWMLTGLALAGVAPDRLARFYPNVR